MHGSLQVQRQQKRGYTEVFGYARAFGSPAGAIHRCLESHPGLHTGVWIPSRGYTQVIGYAQALGSPDGATHGCLSMHEPLGPQAGLGTGGWIPTHGCIQQPRLHKGVWIPNRDYTRAFGVPSGRLCDCASVQNGCVCCFLRWSHGVMRRHVAAYIIVEANYANTVIL